MAGDSGVKRLRTPETLSGLSAIAFTSPNGIALWFSVWATRMRVYFVATDEYYRGKNQRYDQSPVGEAIQEKNAITLLEYGG